MKYKQNITVHSKTKDQTKWQTNKDIAILIELTVSFMLNLILFSLLLSLFSSLSPFLCLNVFAVDLKCVIFLFGHFSSV